MFFALAGAPEQMQQRCLSGAPEQVLGQQDEEQSGEKIK
jgi:hypothetical protein